MLLQFGLDQQVSLTVALLAQEISTDPVSRVDVAV